MLLSRSLIPLFFVFFATGIRADVSLAPLFADHAVLQRDKPVPIWGRADAGESVTVTFHGDTVSTTATSDGRWIAYFDALPASAEPADLVVTGKNKITVHDVLVGEVWLCSGQSNMEFAVRNPAGPTYRVDNADEEVAAANYPLIRHFKVKLNESETPTDALDGSWAVCSPGTVSQFTAVGYFFARNIYEKLHVPVGLVNCTWGGTPVEAWMSPFALDSDPAFAFVRERWKQVLAEYPQKKAAYDAALPMWQKELDAAKAAGKDPEFRMLHPQLRLPHGPHDRWTPTGVFNGMVNPLLPFALRGVLWYQGESNTLLPTAEYHPLFAAMITTWRAHFGQGDLPFYFVQLPNYSFLKNANGTEWALIREGQAQALTLPQTAMAVAIDLGEHDHIHPRNKQEVGRRLALIAETRLYGIPGDDSGPMFAGATRDGNAMRVRFTHADNGLIAHTNPVQSLELAGADKIFHSAQGFIEGETLLVSSPDVKDPVAVRYAWSNDPEANLFNGAGLPAAPFRSDAW
ncbi:MAG TPA: sialate O-acetylesterase [Opitutaceae bacterium]|jgi:sialate O-acetylesterase|nr:sialate O-acetylesterase [Opitutaceae bacterium]